VGELKGVRLRFYLARLFHDDRLPEALGYASAEVELVSDEDWAAELAGCPHPPVYLRQQAIAFATVRLTQVQGADEGYGYAADAARHLWELSVNRSNHPELVARPEAIAALVAAMGPGSRLSGSTEVLMPATAAVWNLATSVAGRTALVEAGVVEALIPMARHAHLECKRGSPQPEVRDAWYEVLERALGAMAVLVVDRNARDRLFYLEPLAHTLVAIAGHPVQSPYNNKDGPGLRNYPEGLETPVMAPIPVEPRAAPSAEYTTGGGDDAMSEGSDTSRESIEREEAQGEEVAAGTGDGKKGRSAIPYVATQEKLCSSSESYVERRPSPDMLAMDALCAAVVRDEEARLGFAKAGGLSQIVKLLGARNTSVRYTAIALMGLYGVDKACIAAMAASGVVIVTLAALVKLLQEGMHELTEGWAADRPVDRMASEMVTAAANSVWGSACACVLPAGPGLSVQTIQCIADMCTQCFVVPGAEGAARGLLGALAAVARHEASARAVLGIVTTSFGAEGGTGGVMEVEGRHAPLLIQALRTASHWSEIAAAVPNHSRIVSSLPIQSEIASALTIQSEIVSALPIKSEALRVRPEEGRGQGGSLATQRRATTSPRGAEADLSPGGAGVRAMAAVAVAHLAGQSFDAIGEDALTGPYRAALLANPKLQTSLVRSVFAAGHTEEATKDLREATCAAFMYLCSEGDDHCFDDEALDGFLKLLETVEVEEDVGVLQTMMPALWGLLRNDRLRRRIVAATCEGAATMPPPRTTEEELEMDKDDEAAAMAARGAVDTAAAGEP
jgi:hypothetical protein